MKKIIDIFDGDYDFLSNFYMAPVLYEGITYTSSEAAFHAQKTLIVEERYKFQNLSPKDSKKLGRKLTLRPDWEEVKTQKMYEIVKAKFEQNYNLREKLLATGDAKLIEGTYWHDNCWGDCYCEKCKNIVGENRLGKILMAVREEFRN